jgi:hypothetical protein
VVEEVPHDDPDAFTIRVGKDAVTVQAGTRLGAVYGLYHLARCARDGRAIVSESVAPAFRRRYVDLGAVGIAPDPGAWSGDDYTHNLRTFHCVLLPRAPWVDPEELARARRQLETYVRRMVAFGYNGLVVNGFLEFVEFYPGSAVERHRAYREAIGGLLRYAHEQGLRVVLKTDMLALTEPLERHLGAIDPEDPALWRVYERGLGRLLDAFPFLDGVMVRIGEAGTVYDTDGWPYYSRLAVRTDRAVAAMLRGLHEPLAARGKTLFFRSWSIGVGEVGDMHTNPRTYERVLGGLDLPHLVISTKYSSGDFGSYLSLNPTLRTGGAPRIIEFQARREYEAFNAFPNYIGPLHQTALLEAGPRVDGVWVWTQDGGPQRAGPMSLYPFHGFWQPIDANAYATARLAWDPSADLVDVTRSWVRETLNPDPNTVDRLTRVLLRSREAVLKGLYVGPFARRRVEAAGLEPPPMAWVFWDIVGGAHSSLSTVYAASRDEFDAAVAEGFEALETVRHMQDLVAGIDPATLPDSHGLWTRSLEYEADLLETLAWYRQAFLSFYRWLDTGDLAFYNDWHAATERFESSRARHEGRYGRDLDFPAYNFSEADVGIEHAERNGEMMWAGRLLLLCIVSVFAWGVRRERGACRALWVGLVAPSEVTRLRQPTRLDRWLVGLLPLALMFGAQLSFSCFLSPAYGLLVLLILGGLFLSLHLQRDPGRRYALLAAASAPLLAGTALLLGVVSLRGPLFFWFGFWTEGAFRVAAIAAALVVGAALLRSVFVAEGEALPGAAGRLLVSIGMPVALVGLVVALIGLEPSLAALNRELVILPLGLSLTHGIATHLNVPAALPFVILATGIAFVVAGRLLRRINVRL